MKTKKLMQFNPCREAIKWMSTQNNATEAWNNCERGDWMLWIAKMLNVDDKKLTMAKAMCAKQVEHLMKDQRSKDALQACFDYVNGKITREQLSIIAAYADAAAYAYAYAAVDAAADAYAANAAAYAAAYAYAVNAADAAAYAYAANAAAYAAAYAAYAAYAADAVSITSLKKSADICREYLTEEVLSKYKKLR